MEPQTDSGSRSPETTSSRVVRRRRLVARRQRARNLQATASNSETTASENPVESPTSSSTVTTTITRNTLAAECNTTTTTLAAKSQDTITSRVPNNSDQCSQEPSTAEELEPDGQLQQQQILVTTGCPSVPVVPSARLRLHSEPQSNNDVTSSVNAVRALFRNRELQRRQRQQVTNFQSPTPSGRTQLTNRASLVSANRRLIERQIEAIQTADSRRWNFDFRNCRPLAQTGHRNDASSSIYNGAVCKSYCWSQSYSDLEIRVKLTRVVRYEEISVIICPRNIRIDIVDEESRGNKRHRDSSDSNRRNDRRSLPNKTLMNGQFEHSVDTASAYWLLDNEGPAIVIYIDKSESMWWKHLLLDEEVKESGPRNYTVSMDLLDDGSRMVIDKLIVEQRNKMNGNDDCFPPV